MDFLAGLNPQQAEAVRHLDGPMLILAGAGSGKTRVITHRIAYMIAERGVPPWSILAVTFTNKASKEMRQRVESLISLPSGQGPQISTFHSFCVRLLRRNGDRLAGLRPGFTRSFTIYDDDDQTVTIKSIYRQIGFDDKVIPARTALSIISNAKCAKQSPEEMRANARDPVKAKIADVFALYEGKLREANALDFDDLLIEAVRLLEYDEPTRRAWNERIEYLMIDEYQDTNRNQYELMQLLAGKRRNVCVVGDEDQSIYSWRGADINNILDFERDFPQAKVIRLEQNYRSTKSILDAASAVVAHNKERKGKKLWTEGAAGEPLSIYEAMDGENEALFIADTIDKLLDRSPEDHVAVLYRTNWQSRQIEEALRRYGRGYSVVGGVSFYQRAEVKDALAYLRAFVSPADNLALFRIINRPARGIGKSTVDAIEQYAIANHVTAWQAIDRLLESGSLGVRASAAIEAFRSLMEELKLTIGRSPDAAIKAILERSGYVKMLQQDHTEDGETRLANLDELINAAAEAAERGESIAEFLDHAALVSDADSVDERSAVSLLTAHNAKGLEFPVVFIAGLEEKLFPHSRSLDSMKMLEEERRLFYVGMTRARKLLYLTFARARRRFGGGSFETSLPSRFLREVPSACSRKLRPQSSIEELELSGEQWEVRQTARKNLYTGKTYNSVENIAQFFKERGVAAPAGPAADPRIAAATPAVMQPPRPAARPPAKRSKLAAGSAITHATYGRGTIVRKEGEGPDAKLTVSFPKHGLKKLIAKYAGLTDEE
jgi:DNA helicase-2/ATP-dependent DNA helicase PcrA